MKNVDPCPTNHAEVQFGSGDFYVFCHACGRKWALMGVTQPEYGENAKGEKIGADPSNMTTGFVDMINVRRRPTEGTQ